MGSISTGKPYEAKGIQASWYRGWNLTTEERDRFRKISIASQAAKARAVSGECDLPKHPVPTPRLNVETLMPVLPPNGLSSLSLFSGGGGLDIGFDRAGYKHVASYELKDVAAAVLSAAHPDWVVYSGAQGDVCEVDWGQYKGKIDVIHGGPPCQPFSHAGHRSGADDVRDMFPQLIRAVLAIKPRAFVAENVSGLATAKFKQYIDDTIIEPLDGLYTVHRFVLQASSFGVPQRRKRVWFVGFRNRSNAKKFIEPQPTHRDTSLPLSELPETMGVRAALGLPDIGVDGLAPTIRSGFSGPRHTTSVVNSVTSLRDWQNLQIWPHGVAESREKAASFVARGGHYRLSIPDCMLMQGFPDTWPLQGAVYKALGLLGNSVAPPMAYQVATAVARALGAH